MAYAIETRELSKSFANCKALDKVSLQISEGEMVALLGASGSGKSTLLRHLPGFITSNSGEIDVLGKTVQANGQRKSNFKEVRNKIGFVFQFHYLLNEFSVIKNVMLPGLKLNKYEEKEVEHRAMEKLTMLGIGHLALKKAHQVSGGEKQRVAIARALIRNPRILIFDEATSALDSANERAIQAELAGVSQNKTTLVIAHRLSTVVDAHEILVMEAGRIIERGNHAALLALQGRYASMWALQQSVD